jgi:protein ImuB
VVSLWLPHWATDRLKIASRRAEAAAVHREARLGKARLNEPRFAWDCEAARPLVTVAAANGRALLAAIDEQAAAAGLMPGMVLADARALMPDLAVRPSRPEKDAAALAQLADWCARFSPWVAVDGADGLFLDITGCAHLFGGEARMLEDLAQRLQKFGYRLRLAVADTPGAAWAAARFATLAHDRDIAILPPGGTREVIASLSVAALRLSPVQVAELERLGLRTIADLYPLPRAGLLRRFGLEPARRLDQALGRIEEPINPRTPVSPHESRLAFAEPILEAPSIAAALERMLGGLCGHLASQQLGVRQLRLALFRVDGSLQRFSIGTSRPNRDPRALQRLFANLFERLDPGFGIEAMSLTATQAEPLEDLQLVLAQARAQSERRAQAEKQARAEKQVPAAAAKMPAAIEPSEMLDEKAIERAVDEAALAALADLFANGRFAQEPAPVRLTRPMPQESHLPERAAVPAPALAGSGDRWTAIALTTVRPVRLLARPEPLETDEETPEALPTSFRWRARPHRIRLAEGPERIAPEWWRPVASNAATGTRDYYRIEDSEGRRFWLYRELTASRWYLHGLFA